MVGFYLLLNKLEMLQRYQELSNIQLVNYNSIQFYSILLLFFLHFLSKGLPDTHSGYGFAIGNVAAFDMNNPESVVSPGGVGFDINCGVVRTFSFLII